MVNLKDKITPWRSQPKMGSEETLAKNEVLDDDQVLDSDACDLFASWVSCVTNPFPVRN